MSGAIPFFLEALLIAAISILGTYVYLDKRAKSHVSLAKSKADEIVADAERQRRDASLAAKDEAIHLRTEIDREVTARRKEIERIERRTEQKEESIDRKFATFDERELAVKRIESAAAAAKDAWEQDRARQAAELEQARTRQAAELGQIKARTVQELERVAGLTADEARQELVAEVEVEARAMAVRRLHEIDIEMHDEAERRSRKILATTIQRIATDYVAESTTSVVPLPSDEMKGRIIGREGRNIRALEQATGVDLIVDDTPEVITVSAYDPLRRELARRSLQKLLQDGRIHPARIEEVVAKTQAELDQTIREEGEKVAYEANVVGLHPDLIKLLGRLKFRTSYGQNVLHHSLEVSMIAAALAAEIGADINVCKTGGLLHDIGKAVDHEVEG
ncbi:MAG: Rnase Y domain-containing protein, partial [Thermomicrobiales bacterium]